MPQIEFMDCPSCSKRVSTTAKLCHHCGQSPNNKNLGEVLRNYIDSKSDVYDPDFEKEIKKIAPHWFAQ